MRVPLPVRLHLVGSTSEISRRLRSLGFGIVNLFTPRFGWFHLISEETSFYGIEVYSFIVCFNWSVCLFVLSLWNILFCGWTFMYFIILSLILIFYIFHHKDWTLYRFMLEVFIFYIIGSNSDLPLQIVV